MRPEAAPAVSREAEPWPALSAILLSRLPNQARGPRRRAGVIAANRPAPPPGICLPFQDMPKAIA